MKKLLGVLLLAVACGPVTAMADTDHADRWQIAAFGTSDPEQLAEIAFDSFSDGTKARIRSYLHETVPDSADGLFADAWLKGYEGDSAAALDGYRICVKRYPEAMRCLYNVVANTSDADEKQKTLQAMMKQDASFHDFMPVRNEYFFLLDERKDEAAAQKFLAQQEQQHSGHAAFDFIRGLQAQNDERNSEKAALYYRKAIQKGQLQSSEVFQRLLDLETGPLFEGNQGRLELAVAMLRDYYMHNPVRDRAPLFALLKRFATAPNTWASRALILKLAWLTTDDKGAAEWEPEILDYVDPVLWAYDAPLAERVYKEVGEGPQTSFQLSWASWIVLYHDLNVDLASALGWQGVEIAFTDKQRRVAINHLMDDFQLLNRCDIADSLARRYLAAYKADAGVYSQYFETNLCTGDLDAAQASLTQRRALGEKDNATLREDELRLAQARADLLPSIIPAAEREPVQVPASNVLALSPDGKLLALGTDPIRLVEVSTHNLIANLGQGTRYRFTQDGRYLVILGDSGITVREVATGRAVGRAAHWRPQSFRDFAISPDGTQLAAADFRGHLYRFDLPGMKLVKARVITAQPLAAYVAWLKGGDIVTASATERVVRRWNPETLASDGKLDGVDWVHVLETSPSGRYLAAADNTSTLHIWDTQSGMEWKHTALPMTFAGQIAFSPKEDQLIANQWNGGGMAAVVSLKGGEPVMLDEGINAYHAYSPDGRTVYRADAGLQVLNAKTWKPRVASDKPWKKPRDLYGIAAYPEMAAYAVFEKDRTEFHALDGDRLLRTVDARLDADPISHEPLRFGAHRGDQLYFYDYASDALTPATDLKGDFDVSARYIVKVAKSTDIAGQIDVEFYHLGETQPYARAAVPAVTEDLQFGDTPTDYGFGSLLDRDGRYWTIRTWWKDGFGHDAQYSRRVRVFDLETGKQVKAFELNDGVRFLAPDYRRQSGLLLKLENSAVPLEFASMNLEPALPLGRDDQLIWQDQRIQIVKRSGGIRFEDLSSGGGRWLLSPSRVPITDAAYLLKNNIVLTLDKDGHVRRVSLNDRLIFY